MTTKSPPKPQRPKGPPRRPVKYPEVKVQLFTGPFALLPEKSKELLGWTTNEEEAKKAGLDEPLLHDLNKQKVWCLNNVHNRPLYMDNVRNLIQELLMKRWRFNMEPIIIGETGLVLNGQHQMIAHVLADQHRLMDNNGQQWKSNWPGPVTMEKLIGFGCDEDDNVIHTMDTCKPRSLTDIIFMSGLFPGLGMTELRLVSRILDSAVRLLWHRTGAAVDAFAPRRTNTEGMDFIHRHGRVVRAVKHVWQEYQGGKFDKKADNWRVNSQRLGPGAAAAMLYLMGACESDGMTYAKAKVASEKVLNWDRWDLATTFWTEFCRGEERMGDLYKSLGYLIDPETGAGGTLAERLCIIVKAWNLYVQDKPMRIKEIEPVIGQESAESPSGLTRIVRPPVVGGIDRGESKLNAPTTVPADDVPGSGPREPSVEDIERQKKEMREEASRKKKEAAEERKRKKEEAATPKNGEPEGDPAKPKKGPPKPLKPKAQKPVEGGQDPEPEVPQYTGPNLA